MLNAAVRRHSDIAFTFGTGNRGNGESTPAASTIIEAGHAPNAVIVTDIDQATLRPFVYSGDHQTPNPCGSDAFRRHHGYTCLGAFTGWEMNFGSVGTSVASSYVAGSLALMHQFFPAPDPRAAHRPALCRTAELQGLASSQVGCGIVNFATATRPVGTASVPTSTSITATAPAAQTTISTSPAMQFGAADLLILDALDYPFTIPLEALTQNRDRPLSRLLADWTTPARLRTDVPAGPARLRHGRHEPRFP